MQCCNTVSLTTDLSMNTTQNKFFNLECSQRLEKRHFTNQNAIVLEKYISCSHIESSNMKIEAFSELILTNSIQNKLGGIIILSRTPSQEFCILMNVDEFF